MSDLSITPRRTRCISILLALLICLLMLGIVGNAAAVAGPTVLTDCTTIDTPGTYVLGGNIDGSSNTTCIVITTSDVVLDGAGFSITGSDSWDSVGVHVNGSSGRLQNVTVTDLTLTDWETGLYYDASDAGTIQNVTATSNEDYGFNFVGATNVVLNDVATADHDGWNGAGIRIYGGSGHTIGDSSFTNDVIGVMMIDAQSITVRDSSFAGTGPAVDVDDSGAVVVDNNTVIDGSLGAISGTNGPANRFTNNTIAESSRYATGADCGGMSVNNAANDIIANNSWDECDSGVHIDDSTSIEFRNNTIYGTNGQGGNADYGLWVSGGAYNQILDNHIENNGRSYTKRAGILLGTHQATLSGNTMIGNGFNLEIGTGGNWSSLSHSIDATNTVEGRPVAYHVNETGITVDPNAGWVALIGTKDAVIADMDFAAFNRENILLRFADDTTIRNVTMSPSWVGIQTYDDSDRTRIEDSYIDSGRGISLSEAPDTVVVNTTVLNSGGYGIYLSDSPRPIIENVTVIGSDRKGIGVRNGESTTQRVTVANSTINNNGWGGIDIYRAARSTISGNTVQNNGGTGIEGQRYVHNTTITNNVVTGNNGHGIQFELFEADNDITQNTITENTQSGISLANEGENATITGNVLTGNAIGINLPSAFVRVTVYDNRFNNTQNVVFADPAGVTNATWNTTSHAGTNVIGGATIAGNYWANHSGTGFSESCTDRGDGICDASYTLAPGHVDQLPLTGVLTVTTPAQFLMAIDTTNTPIEAGESLNVTATVQNTGGETATQSITLTVNDTLVASQPVTLDAGNTTTLTFSYDTTTADIGEYPVVVASANSSDTRLVNVTSSAAPLVSVNSITVVNGTAPGTMPYVEARLDAQPMLQLNLRSSEFGDYDLEGIGADHTTEFEITLTVKDFDPGLLIGAGNLTDWTATQIGPTTTEITVRVRPVATQSILQCDNAGTCTTPELQNWPTGSNDTATNRTNVTVALAIDDLHSYPSSQQPLLKGASITTDAQLFGAPIYTPSALGQPASLSLLVGGPHYTVGGTPNTGYYTAVLPDALLAAWNVTSPTELEAAYQGTNIGFTATPVSDGMRIHVETHYSAGTVAISAADTTSPHAAAGPDQTTGVNQAITLDGSASTDNYGIVEYAWTFDDGTSTTGPTPTKTYSTAGTYTVTLTVTDGKGNTDMDTLTVTVTKPSNSGSNTGQTSPPSNTAPTATPTPATATATPPTVTPTATASETTTPDAVTTPTETTATQTMTTTATVTTTPQSSSTQTTTTTPGFGLIVALLSLFATALLARRRD